MSAISGGEGSHFAAVACGGVPTVRAVTKALPSLICLALAAPWADAADAPPWLADARAQALQLVTQAAQRHAPAGAQVLAHSGELDTRLQLAPCARVRAVLPATVRATGTLRVGLRCEAGPVPWQVWLPVTVQLWAPALVARAALPAGTALDVAHFTLAPADWAATPAPPLPATEDLQGRVLNRPLAAGQPLRAADLRARQWFAAGETVQIVAQGNGFAVGAEGTALAAGLEGQPTRVRTAAGRIVTARAVGPQRVALAL